MLIDPQKYGAEQSALLPNKPFHRIAARLRFWLNLKSHGLGGAR